MTIENAVIYREEGFFPGTLHTNGMYLDETSGDDIVLDAKGCYAIPGLVDIHQHGCVGHDYATASADKIEIMLRYQLSQGVTAVCPTIMTLPLAQMAAACRRFGRFRGTAGAEVAGLYLEGPFLSPGKAGAQNPRHMLLPDASALQHILEEANGLVCFMAIAPELEGACQLVRTYREHVKFCLAHSSADYKNAFNALQAGIRQVTHLFNAMPPFHHRAPGVVGAAFDNPACMVELICDGIHIHPAVVRAVFRLFEGRVIMISDSMAATGLPSGYYTLGDLPVSVEGKRAVLAGENTLAGSASTLMDCLRVAVTQMGIPLHEAVKSASQNPAKALGADNLGRLERGCRADILLIDKSLQIVHIIKNSEMQACS